MSRQQQRIFQHEREAQATGPLESEMTRRIVRRGISGAFLGINVPANAPMAFQRHLATDLHAAMILPGGGAHHA